MKKTIFSILILLVVSGVALFFIFKPVIQHPNGYTFEKKGDAIKNYYVFSYYLKHDKGIKHDGINYPYGDHLLYINSHPLYSQIVKFINSNIYTLENHGVGVLNLIMIISILLATPLIFLILKRFALPNWYAIIISLVIVFLTPQFDRIHGHFEMVYAFFIPLFWYLLIRLRDGDRIYLWAGLLVTAGLIGSFTSAYYAALYLIFILAVILIDAWRYRKKLSKYKKMGLVLFISAIIPVIAVQSVVSLTDWVNDRPDNPWGFYVFHSNIFSIFLPHDSLFQKILSPLELKFQWEGRAYVGLPATLLAISIVISIIYFFTKYKHFNSKILFPNRELNVYLAASFLVLLFSMCIPFKLGLKFLTELIPPVKQFRALGRFSWIFYYVFTVYTAYYFYILYKRMKQKKLYIVAVVIMCFVIFSWSMDAAFNIKKSMKGLISPNNLLESTHDNYILNFDTNDVNINTFQAILFLPFENTCGDKLLFNNTEHAVNQAMKYSYHTGLPMIQTFTPRISIAQALSSIQLLADSSIYKTRLDDMNNKDILLISSKLTELDDKEQWILSNSSVFYETKEYTLSVLPVQFFNNAYYQWKKNVKQSIDTFNCNDNICSNGCLDDIYYDSFKKNKFDRTFTGQGALYLKKGKLELLNNTLISEENQYVGSSEISFWMYVDTRKYSMPSAKLKLWNIKDNKLLEEIKLNTREIHNVYKQWVRISYTISLAEHVRYQIIIKGKYITVDDLLIKPVNCDVAVKLNNNDLLYNNFYFND